MKSDLIVALEQLERERGIKKEDILSTIEGAVIAALKRHLGKNVNVAVTIDPGSAQIEAYLVKKVSAQVQDPELEMSLEEARRVRPDAALDSEVRIPVATEEFARIAAQTAKQVLVQKVREVERTNLYEEFKPKEGEVVSGSVRRFQDRDIVVDVGKAEALLPLREQIRRERYGIGSPVRALILKVDRSQRGPQVILSRASSLFLKRLFEMEVPEVGDKVVEILEVARDPGFRAKVVVRTNDPRVDPVGACVGIRGSRIRSIMNELGGERVDLIPHSPDPAQMLANAVAPAKVSSVRILDREARKAELIVADEQLSLAIGKEGQNIRLACKITGWGLEVKSEGERAAQTKKVRAAEAEDLAALEGVGSKLAELLVKGGLGDVEKLAGAQVDDLTTLQGVGEKTAKKIIAGAQKFLTEHGGGEPPAIPHTKEGKDEESKGTQGTEGIQEGGKVGEAGS